MKDKFLRLPGMPNVTGVWYDQDGNEISMHEAMARFQAGPDIQIATDSVSRFIWNAAGVVTVFAPFDLKPLPGRAALDRPPHLFATATFHRERQFGKPPREIAEFVQYSQTRTAALAAHDQAVVHVRQLLRESRRKPWRWLYWPRLLTLGLATLGLMWVLSWIVYGVMILVGKW